MIPGFPKWFAIMTLAVFLPTPGSSTSFSMEEGTAPPCFSITAAAQLIIALALFLKNPVDLTSSRSSVSDARENAARSGYFLKSPLVTMFTLLSVHWAERMEPTRSWPASAKTR